MALLGFAKHHNGNESIAKAKKSAAKAKKSTAKAKKSTAPRGTATARHSSVLHGSGKAVRRGAMPGNAKVLCCYERHRHSVEKLNTDKRKRGHGEASQRQSKTSDSIGGAVI